MWQPRGPCNYSTSRKRRASMCRCVCVKTEAEREVQRGRVCARLLWLIRGQPGRILLINDWCVCASVELPGQTPPLGSFINMNSVTQNALHSVRGSDLRIPWPRLLSGLPGTAPSIDFLLTCDVWSPEFWPYAIYVFPPHCWKNPGHIPWGE